jgi:hypothetical protein
MNWGAALVPPPLCRLRRRPSPAPDVFPRGVRCGGDSDPGREYDAHERAAFVGAEADQVRVGGADLPECAF